ncbi:MAG: hypothetical protein WBA17_12150 [Saprospiraceae bacterium]
MTATATNRLPKLIHLTDDEPGLGRVLNEKTGAFHYVDVDGKRIKRKKVIERIEAIVIPPAWRDVWICPDPNGYLLCTGRDEKDRKQYRYHPDWTAYQQQTKFDRLIEFAETLPVIRRRVHDQLRRTEWDRERVLALAVALLDETGMRIGNQSYQDTNGTYGLTTLRRKHVDFNSEGIQFHFRGKSKQDREVELHDPELIQLVKDVTDLPGYRLFRYQGTDGKVHDLDSADVNDYIRQLSDQADFSAKTFRNWAGTTAAVEYYPEALKEYRTKENRRNLENILLDKVCTFLGNTPAICREYYIHPAVLRAVRAEKIPSPKKLSVREQKIFGEELEREELIAYRLMLRG